MASVRAERQGGDAGLIQKVTSKEIPNLNKVPKDSLDRYGSFAVPYRASSVIRVFQAVNTSSRLPV